MMLNNSHFDQVDAGFYKVPTLVPVTSDFYFQFIVLGCIFSLSSIIAQTQFVNRGLRAFQIAWKVILNFEPEEMGIRSVISRSIHTSSVYEPAILFIDNIEKHITERDIWNALKKPFGQRKTVMEKITLHTTKDKYVKNKMIALITIPRMYLHASGILANASSMRKWSVKEIKKIGSLNKPGRLWLTRRANSTKLPASVAEYSSTFPLDLKLFHVSFGYRNIDGGFSVPSSMNNLSESCLDCMVKQCSQTGIERIVLVTPESGKNSNIALSWCRLYKNFFYYTAAMGASRTKFDNVVKNPSCVAIGPLCLAYTTDDEARREKMLQKFKEHVEIGCSLRKSLMFVLRKNPVHQDFLDVLRLNKSRLPPCSIAVSGNYSQVLPALLSEFNFYVVIKGHQLNQGINGGLKKMLMNGDIPVNKVLLHSNAPNTDFGCQTYQDFKNKFLRKRITYLHPEGVNYIKDAFTCCDKHDVLCDSRIIHVILELLASLINLPPTALAPVMKRNCEQFYMFDS